LCLLTAVPLKLHPSPTSRRNHAATPQHHQTLTFQDLVALGWRRRDVRYPVALAQPGILKGAGGRAGRRSA
jgi:hypothetical protein